MGAATPQTVALIAAELLGPQRPVAHFKPLKVASDRIVLLGDIAPAAEAPSEIIIKWSAHPGYAEHEAAFCAQLSQRPGASQVVAVDRERCVVVMTKGCGRVVAAQRLLGEPELNWVTSSLSALHQSRLTADMQGGRVPIRHPWPVMPRLRHILALGLVTAEVAGHVRTLVDAIDRALNGLDAPRVPIHGDPCAHNMLLDGHHRCIHLIDFEYATSGDPMSDLAFFVVASGVLDQGSRGAQAIFTSYQTQTDGLPTPSAFNRFLLYIAYQRLFRHVASYEELLSGISVHLGSARAAFFVDLDEIIRHGLVDQTLQKTAEKI